MTTEERLTALESDRAILNRIASEQLLRLRDLEHNVTILVGVQGSQGQDIRAMKADVSAIKERLDGVESRLDRMESHLDERFDAIDKRFDAVLALLKNLQSPSGQ
jgi:tetrahydromethanopterin S-methyltransferase subunit G